MEVIVISSRLHRAYGHSGELISDVDICFTDFFIVQNCQQLQRTAECRVLHNRVSNIREPIATLESRMQPKRFDSFCGKLIAISDSGLQLCTAHLRL
jgi:hypothetical protein